MCASLSMLSLPQRSHSMRRNQDGNARTARPWPPRQRATARCRRCASGAAGAAGSPGPLSAIQIFPCFHVHHLPLRASCSTFARASARFASACSRSSLVCWARGSSASWAMTFSCFPTERCYLTAFMAAYTGDLHHGCTAVAALLACPGVRCCQRRDAVRAVSLARGTQPIAYRRRRRAPTGPPSRAAHHTASVCRITRDVILRDVCAVGLSDTRPALPTRRPAPALRRRRAHNKGGGLPRRPVKSG